ncbi:MAG: response regulator [Lachnospiraceae bacterium]|nr:response regulator [Lachnospiraceae bacterium]
MEDASQRLRIVIADDEPITKMDLNEMLTETGYEVVGEAADGFDAVECCRIHHPDLVILDIKMPYLDGLSAAKIINSESLADTIMILTAYDDKEFVERAKENGVSGYLVKPIEEKSIVPSIELAVSCSKEIHRLKKDIEKANERLENRVIVEKAKGRIMQQQNMNEQEAYEYIRKLSQLKHLSMKRVSELILVQ